jgi:hypothetical protein
VAGLQKVKSIMTKLKLDLRHLDPAGTVALANTIKTAMTGNAKLR